MLVFLLFFAIGQCNAYTNTQICDYSKNVTRILLAERIWPYSMTENSIKPLYDTCVDKKNQNIIWGGAVLGVLLAPIVMPLFGGLYGAAAITHGLALLGGGSLAAGGFGMIGGMISSAAIGGGIGYFLGENYDEKCYSEVIAKFEHFKTFDTYIFFDDDVLYEGMIVDRLFQGDGTLYARDKTIVYSGLFEKGLPSFCKN